MSKNKVIKSVGFNITNPDDAEILKAVKRRNFSGYVKKLLLEDIRANGTKKADPVKEETAAERMERMRSQMLTNKSVNGQTNTITND